MWIAVIMLCQKTDRGQGRERAPMALIRIAHAGDNQRLLQNAADTVARVKNRRAILEYQLDLAAKRLAFALRHRGEVVPAIDNRAGIRALETTDQASSRRLARSGFANQAIDLARRDLKRKVVHGGKDLTLKT